MEKDWHDYRKRLETALRNVTECGEISSRNRSLILDFLSRCKVEGLSPGRTARYGALPSKKTT